MPFLVLKSKKTVIKRILLDDHKKLTIGMLADNDLIIDDPAVSGHHAEIEAENDLFYITDRQSRNGTFINNELIISRLLTQNDEITIGEHTLEFFYEKEENIPLPTGTLNVHMTMPLDTQQHRSRLARSISQFAEETGDKQTIAILTYMDGSNRNFPLRKFPVTIGKTRENDIQIKGFGVGKTAAVIDLVDDEYRLMPAAGLSKPKINYQTVRNETPLTEFDVIEIGSAQLQFHFQSMNTSNGDFHE